jgi:probable F420-dependent oxidoreductase
MEFGLSLPQTGRLANLDSLRMVAMAAENAGYASLWAFDQVLTPRATKASLPGPSPAEPHTVLDPIVALATAAAVTERIRVGTNTLIAPLYPPVLLARSAAALDQLSHGRFTLGLGCGWSSEDFEAVGAARLGVQRRIEAMLEVMARVWRDDVVDIETAWERVAPTPIGPKPIAKHVPLLLEAHNDADLERIARRCNGLMASGQSRDELAVMWSTVTRIANRYARDPETLRLVITANIVVTEEGLGGARREFTGSIDQVRDDIERLRDIGAHEVILDLQSTATSAGHLLDLAAQLTAPVDALTEQSGRSPLAH